VFGVSNDVKVTARMGANENKPPGGDAVITKVRYKR
jgi:hypothetical protein